MKPSVTYLIIGMLVIVLLAGVFATMNAMMSQAYGVSPAEYNFTDADKMNNLTSLINEIHDETTTISTTTGVFDFIDSLFSNAYNVALLLPQSIGVAVDMISSSFQNLGLGETGSLIVTVISLVLIVLLVIGVILSILLKTDLI